MYGEMVMVGVTNLCADIIANLEPPGEVELWINQSVDSVICAYLLQNLLSSKFLITVGKCFIDDYNALDQMFPLSTAPICIFIGFGGRVNIAPMIRPSVKKIYILDRLRPLNYAVFDDPRVSIALPEEELQQIKTSSFIQQANAINESPISIIKTKLGEFVVPPLSAWLIDPLIHFGLLGGYAAFLISVALADSLLVDRVTMRFYNDMMMHLDSLARVHVQGTLHDALIFAGDGLLLPFLGNHSLREILSTSPLFFNEIMHEHPGDLAEHLSHLKTSLDLNLKEFTETNTGSRYIPDALVRRLKSIFPKSIGCTFSVELMTNRLRVTNLDLALLLVEELHNEKNTMIGLQKTGYRSFMLLNMCENGAIKHEALEELFRRNRSSSEILMGALRELCILRRYNKYEGIRDMIEGYVVENFKIGSNIYWSARLAATFARIISKGVPEVAPLIVLLYGDEENTCIGWRNGSNSSLRNEAGLIFSSIANKHSIGISQTGFSDCYVYCRQGTKLFTSIFADFKQSAVVAGMRAKKSRKATSR